MTALNVRVVHELGTDFPVSPAWTDDGDAFASVTFAPGTSITFFDVESVNRFVEALGRVRAHLAHQVSSVGRVSAERSEFAKEA